MAQQTYDLGPVCPIYKGDWSAKATYETLNMVRHGTALWVMTAKAYTVGFHTVRLIDVLEKGRTGRSGGSERRNRGQGRFACGEGRMGQWNGLRKQHYAN